ncbi:MAG TPA: E3 binding domain-containing protein, partial [Acidimicrobiales bacterium]|nr:E3 binding domain-containing protein [Acidimicrobiales bacterium]
MGAFRMPSLGADMDVGTVTQWLIKAGDLVHRGDIVAVVDTEKSTIEVEIFESGVVEAILVDEGEEVAVGTPLAQISPNGTAVPPKKDAPRATVAKGEPALVTSPVVRHLAEKLGVDLGTLTGSGAGGRVTRADVERAARTVATTPGASVPRAPGSDASVASAPAKHDDAVRARRPRSSPWARRIAAERGVDLATVKGTGPAGAVVAADLSGMEASSPAESTAREGAITAVKPLSDRDSTDRQ